MFCQNFKGVNSVSLQHTVVSIYPLTVFFSYALEDKYADFQRKISTVTSCGIPQTIYKRGCAVETFENIMVQSFYFI